MSSEKDLNSEQRWIVSVAIPRPLEGYFTYKVDEKWLPFIKPRVWVRVPFGRTEVMAFVVDHPKPISELSPDIPEEKLKPISEVGPEDEAISQEVFDLCKWASDYYQCPLGELLSGAYFKLEGKIRPLASYDEPPLLYELSVEQKGVYEAILNSFESKTAPKVTLLEGITGSGKTEVYIELAREVLKRGESVLVLVPEIALTPQLYQRFEKRLGVRIGVWHSALAEGKKRDQIAAMKAGTLRVVVGARSALFAPLQKTGLIIIDEEHDPTFKQEERARYHARDLAIVRARSNGAKVILGSATPSFETLERVREGRYGFQQLKSRLGKATLPTIETVHLGEEPRVEGLRAPFAEKTLEAIRATLLQGDQVMVYLNRRGFASFLVCEPCGFVKECPNCSVSLTYHKKPLSLRCHICGHQEHPSDTCEKCHASDWSPVGAGTESLEEELPGFLPEAKPLRLDRDQITSMSRLEAALESFRKGEFNLLLGTQMLVKGHDFPNVTLVVVVLADALFRWPDFRAPERALQVLTQVAGRAGRAEKPGRVLIQTFQPEHQVIQVLKGELSREAFIDSERELRKLLNYPPFGRLALLRVEADQQKDAMDRAKILYEQLQKDDGGDFQAIGPSEAFLEKAKGIFRWDVLLKAQKIDSLWRPTRAAKLHFQRQKWKLTVDIDPYGIQ